ncbi:hypothetical protein [Serratia ficaria]|uniref:hypothetical protein n=1 Tax=Serratia ficaria TaxID=61651 RepID=UPI0012EE50A1|nr:hypothetical protein [Serratia ficaria]
MTEHEGPAQSAQQDGLMQKLLMLMGLQRLLGSNGAQPTEQSPRQPENGMSDEQSSASGGVMQKMQQMMQQLMQIMQQLLGSNGAQPTEQSPRQPENGMSDGQSSASGGVMQQLMQIMQQLAGGGQKAVLSGENGKAESGGAAQPAQQDGGNMLSKLLGSVLQMVGLDALMSKLGGSQNNGG